MALINVAAREIHGKIVYYGPGLCGKTTNLQFIHGKIPQNGRSDLLSIATETEREQVWIIHERPDVRYIYTDGRPFPPPDELWPTFEGHSIGHWEGDTLVIETRAIKGGVPINRTGAALSDTATVHERIRKIDDRTLQSEVIIDDPVAFTRPWTFTRRYTKRDEQYFRMENVTSLENQRNPLVDGQTTIVLDADTSSPYPPDLRRYAVPNFPRSE